MVLAMTNDRGNAVLQIEKGWLIGLLFTFAAQIFTVGWWSSSQAAQLTEIQGRLHALEGQLIAAATDNGVKSDKLSRLEERIEHLGESNKELSNHLIVIEGYLHTTARGGSK